MISSSSRPVYLFAPAQFLGDQLFSYGQNFSFSLRLDRGVRHPSLSDVILEGAGLRVSTSLGDLRHSVPCGRKIYYSFMLEEIKWTPHLSPLQFQSLLQNLTAIKIRATFGSENGRGYLDNVSLVSAQRGPGQVRASWVRICRCPPGLEGDQCERCAPGYRRTDPSRGVFSGCGPCECPKGSCDPVTGECLPSDDTNQGCPTGYTGVGCRDCSEGYYRETVRGDGFPPPCQLCSCDQRGSETLQCDASGKCRCKTGFEGDKCEREKATCPSCFKPVMTQLDELTLRVHDVESLYSSPDVGLTDKVAMEAALKSVQNQLDDLQDQQNDISDLERRLQSRVSAVSSEQVDQQQDLQKLSTAVDDTQNLQLKYKEQVGTVETMIKEMSLLLDKAQNSLNSIARKREVPKADSPSVSNPFSSLLQIATNLVQQYKSTENSVEETANEALKDSQQSQSLLSPIIDRENQVKKLIQELKDKYDQLSFTVKASEKEATEVSSNATDQIQRAAGLLQDVLNAEDKIPSPLQMEVNAMLAKLDILKAATEGNLTALEVLQDTVEQEKNSSLDLLNQGKTAQQEFNKLVTRVDAAKAETEDALKRIQGNTNDLQDAVNTLKGFEDQLDKARSDADAAIGRLPIINSTVQSANKDNTATLGLLDGVSEGYDQTLATVGQLKDAVDTVQASASSLPSASDLLNQATKLKTDTQGLVSSSTSTAAQVKDELEQARDLDQQAQEAADDAAAALENSLRTRDSVRKTLQDVNNMLRNLNSSEPLDMSRLKRLEDSVGGAQKQVSSLVPRLELMQQKEQAYRRYLKNLDQDLTTILQDIANLEDILKSVPVGCYNNYPTEQAG